MGETEVVEVDVGLTGEIRFDRLAGEVRKGATLAAALSGEVLRGGGGGGRLRKEVREEK